MYTMCNKYLLSKIISTVYNLHFFGIYKEYRFLESYGRTRD